VARPACLLLPLLLAACRTTAPLAPETIPVAIGGRTFTLEVAADEWTRMRGLSDRREIASSGGMLFVYPTHRPLEFVMRRCVVPIDLLIVADDGAVLAVHEMAVEPYGTPDPRLPRYGHESPARLAIELRGGTARALGVRPGVRVRFLRPPPRAS
jgi:uncharacterized membrane protein (UPF0127 family)